VFLLSIAQATSSPVNQTTAQKWSEFSTNKTANCGLKQFGWLQSSHPNVASAQIDNGLQFLTAACLQVVGPRKGSSRPELEDLSHRATRVGALSLLRLRGRVDLELALSGRVRESLLPMGNLPGDQIVPVQTSVGRRTRARAGRDRLVPEAHLNHPPTDQQPATMRLFFFS